METEDEILDKYESAKDGPDSLDDSAENALLGPSLDSSIDTSNTAPAVHNLEADAKAISDSQVSLKITDKQDGLHDTKELEIASASIVDEVEPTLQIKITQVTGSDGSKLEKPRGTQKGEDEERKEFLNEISPSKNADNLQCAKENVEKNLRETMDTEDLLQVTTVKEMNDDIDVPDKDENSSSTDSSEKDDNDEAMDTRVEGDSKLVKDDNTLDIDEYSPVLDDKFLDDAEIDESCDKPTKDDGESVDAVDIEENSPRLDDKFVDDAEIDESRDKATKDGNECVDSVDIEENSPLADELNKDVEEEYQSHLNKENGDNKMEGNDLEDQENESDVKSKVSECEMEGVEDGEKVDITNCEKPLVNEKHIDVATETDTAIVANGSRKNCDLLAKKSVVETAEDDVAPTAGDETKTGEFFTKIIYIFKTQTYLCLQSPIAYR